VACLPKFADGGLARWQRYVRVDATIVSRGGFFALTGPVQDSIPSNDSVNDQADFGMLPRKRSRSTTNSLRRACKMPTSNSAGFMRASTCSLRHSPSWHQLQKCSQLFLNK
jgi:hypothetical protein